MSRRPLSILLALSCLIAVTSIARAESRGERGELGDPTDSEMLANFQTPSKNISCQLFKQAYQNGSETSLQCDMADMAGPSLPKPKDCDLDSGNGAVLGEDGPAEVACSNETIINTSLPILAYGEVMQNAGFTCRSEPTGLTCLNSQQHGFRLSRAKQELF
jgi:hypothetical protein